MPVRTSISRTPRDGPSSDVSSRTPPTCDRCPTRRLSSSPARARPKKSMFLPDVIGILAAADDRTQRALRSNRRHSRQGSLRGDERKAAKSGLRRHHGRGRGACRRHQDDGLAGPPPAGEGERRHPPARHRGDDDARLCPQPPRRQPHRRLHRPGRGDRADAPPLALRRHAGGPVGRAVGGRPRALRLVEHATAPTSRRARSARSSSAGRTRSC